MNNRAKSTLVILALALLLVFGGFEPVAASQGIGLIVGPDFDLGEVEKRQIYHAGQMCIVNTGDEPSWYKMDVSYLQNQSQLPVPKEWITFEPQRFYLYPGVNGVYQFDYAQKIVQVYLSIPRNARKGEYFCYLEASTDSGSWLSLAVGAPFSFTVVPDINKKKHKSR